MVLLFVFKFGHDDGIKLEKYLESKLLSYLWQCLYSSVRESGLGGVSGVRVGVAGGQVDHVRRSFIK